MSKRICLYALLAIISVGLVLVCALPNSIAEAPQASMWRPALGAFLASEPVTVTLQQGLARYQLCEQ
jgi:hypothetical protein